MPENPQGKKSSRLPEGRGIRKIEMAEVESPPAMAGPDRMEIDVSQADRVLLDEIRTRLEARYGSKVSNSQVIRWAVWHCRWDDVFKP